MQIVDAGRGKHFADRLHVRFRKPFQFLQALQKNNRSCSKRLSEYVFENCTIRIKPIIFLSFILFLLWVYIIRKELQPFENVLIRVLSIAITLQSFDLYVAVINTVILLFFYLIQRKNVKKVYELNLLLIFFGFSIW